MMFFRLAAVSPSRRRALRALLAAHLAALGLTIFGLLLQGERHRPLALGNVALILGIVEGALLVGWRLAQLPKSQALEFLLASPLRPRRVLVLEASVGLARLAIVTLSGFPVLALALVEGLILPDDVSTLLMVPFLWGAVTGLGLTTWAYETKSVRRWGERCIAVGIIVYLVIGVLAAEHLPLWLAALPNGVGQRVYAAFQALHEYNPFGVMRFAMEQTPAWSRSRVAFIEASGAGLALALLCRAAWRLQGHFHDLHYQPALAPRAASRPEVGDAPLTWWAVKRVTRYSGRINLWLAGGFGVLYAAYTVLGAMWPAWMGRQVFATFDDLGGVPMLATALTLLAAVPAAFQYGLWDANAHDRRQRLELLMLTDLDGRAYWQAAAAAAWRRGRGYFGIALMMWSAALLAGSLTAGQVLAALAAGVILWGFYFVLGFRAFTRGAQANTLGLMLTLLLPIATWLLFLAGQPRLAELLPPGAVFGPARRFTWTWLLGLVACGLATLALSVEAQRRCALNLRDWYGRHQDHGS